MSEEPQVNELMIRGIVVGVFQENCWIIGNRRTREGIAIDPGDQADDILNLAKDMGINVKVIANSHAHVDHIMGVGPLKERTGAKFLMHEGELAIAANAASTARAFTGRDYDEPPPPDAYLNEGDEIDVDGVKLKVIHTPGHTPGSLSFYTEGMLFSGDTLFHGSIGRTDLPGGDHLQEMASIVDRLLELPDDTIVLPGHMDETRIGVERETNPFIRQELERRRGGLKTPPFD